MFNADQFAKQLQAGIFNEINKKSGTLANEIATETGIDKMCCPEHGGTAQNFRMETITPGATKTQLRFDVCCEKLAAQIQSKQ